MSSRIGVSVDGGTRRNIRNGNEDPSEGNGSNEVHNQWMKAMRPCLRGADQAGEHLGRPALSGRKAHRKTCPEDKQGRRGEKKQERDDERHFRGKDREHELPRMLETLCADQAQDGPRRGTSENISSSDSNMHLKNILKAGEPSNLSKRQHTSSRSQTIGFLQTATSNLNSTSGRPTFQSRFIHPPSPAPSSRDSDPFWTEVRIGAGTGQPSQNHSSQRNSSESDDEEGEDKNEDIEKGEEEGGGVVDVTGQAMCSAESPPCIPSGERRISKREKSRSKSLRRRQRKWGKWRPSQQQERTQSSTETPATSCSSNEDEEALSMRDKEGFICAVCLDVYFSPYMCHPCNHIFCEPCLRTLAKNNSTNTPCPLCRTIITHVFFQKELNQTVKTFFPKEYLTRKQNFQRAPCSKWPLPSCRKLFRIFRGFQRQSNPSMRRHFPHGAGFPLDTMDFEDDSRGWRFDMDMVIIYIYSVNWVIGFFIFCFLCYLFFPSF